MLVAVDLSLNLGVVVQYLSYLYFKIHRWTLLDSLPPIQIYIHAHEPPFAWHNQQPNIYNHDIL